MGLGAHCYLRRLSAMFMTAPYDLHDRPCPQDAGIDQDPLHGFVYTSFQVPLLMLLMLLMLLGKRKSKKGVDIKERGNTLTLKHTCACTSSCALRIGVQQALVCAVPVCGTGVRYQCHTPLHRSGRPRSATATPPGKHWSMATRRWLRCVAPLLGMRGGMRPLTAASWERHFGVWVV